MAAQPYDSDLYTESRRICQLLFLSRAELDHAVQNGRANIESSNDAIHRANRQLHSLNSAPKDPSD